MTVAELIVLLQRLPQSAEIAVPGAMAQPLEPEIVAVNRFAYPRGEYNSTRRMFRNPDNAYLIRPGREII